ncbi:Branched-chain-amino-acid aminotransferase [Hypsibius exemplaris]|uniref:Branched-chain-amino-acid aminotransferase n=1 Tax=Hypsibius exemplaris TaxID=2072580 RepID=A0A1W0WU39_HYPEX|nr:Branched-chain-amino-acid aminotransferase [Hypsibius exemplaris]
MQALRKASFRSDKLQPVLVQLTDGRSYASAATHFSGGSDPRHFKHQDLELHSSKKLQKKPDFGKLIFGRHFSDHMLDVAWSESHGWGVPRIGPIRNIELHPAAKVLHYALELFEGMKAYYGDDGKVRLFRPDQNMERMQTSAKRTSLPDFDGKRAHALHRSAHRRGPQLGPAESRQQPYEALLYVITGPVGPYFPTGLKPVSLLADPQHVRSWPGGAGAYKMGSNYAPTIHVQKEAEKQGCQQVLWLHGDDHQVTEVGTMNVMVFWINENGEKELVTAPLDGLILPGVTRNSLLALSREWGEFKVSERNFTMGDIEKAVEQKRLIEFFGCGTACVVCPVHNILYAGRNIKIPVPNEKASLSGRFLRTLNDITYGRVRGHPWAVDIDELIATVPVSERIAVKSR